VNPKLRLWRWVAWIGLLGILVIQLFLSFPLKPRQGVGWILPAVMLVLVSLGLFFYYRSSWHEGTHYHNNVNWSVNVFWSGGYGDECHRYGKLVDSYSTAAVPLVQTLLTLLFGALAAGIKIALLQRWQPATARISAPAGASPPEIVSG